MRKKGYISMIIFAIISSFLTTGCFKDESEDAKNEEKASRDAYIQSLENDGYTVIGEDGIYYVVVVEGTGVKPTENNYVIIDFTGTKTDNTIIETTDASLADDWYYSQYYDHYVYGPKKIFLGYSIEGFVIGLKKMQEGGRSIIIIPSNLGFWRNDYITVVYDTKLLKVIDNPLTYDSLQVLSYVNNRMNNPVFYNDIYYDEQQGLMPAYEDSMSIEPNDSVYVRFSSYYVLEDTTILFESNADNNEPLKFKYSATAIAPASYLPFTEGFLSAMDTMSVGTVAKILVPYEYGYKEAGYRDPDYDYIIVPEFTSLIYDIEIENVIKP